MIKKAMLARAVAVLDALDAEYFITVDGQEPVQRTSAITAEAKKARPNVMRNREWGYHSGVKLMRTGVPVTFVYPQGVDREECEEFDKCVIDYAKLTHSLRVADLLVERTATKLTLTKLI